MGSRVSENSCSAGVDAGESAAMSKEDDKGGPIVEVEDLHTNEDTKFHAKWTDTVQHIWDQSYLELGETRRPTDVFECKDGQSLMSVLNLTLEQLREQHTCQNHKFQIRGGPGGA
jgi:hypothetical protein